jgi:hypothetical protein
VSTSYRITYVAGGHSADGASVEEIMDIVCEEFPNAVYRRGKVYESNEGFCVTPNFIATIKCVNTTKKIAGCFKSNIFSKD